jgi:hypothetical protein
LREPTFRDRDIASQFHDGEERLKRGGAGEALRLFLDVYDQAKTGMGAMDCVKNAYAKLGSDVELEHSIQEELFLKLQRIASLEPQYMRYRVEAAYYIGFIYAKRGDAEQARKYLLEVCQTAPVSLDPGSVWMKAKTLLLETLYLQGEF